MMLIDIGYKNYVRAEEVQEILDNSGRKAARVRKGAKSSGLLVNAASGVSAKSMVILRSGHVILSAMDCETLTEMLANALSIRPKPNVSVVPPGARLIDSGYDKAPERIQSVQDELPF